MQHMALYDPCVTKQLSSMSCMVSDLSKSGCLGRYERPRFTIIRLSQG